MPSPSDRDVAQLCAAMVLLAPHAHRVPRREALIVTLASDRFVRHGRAARIRRPVWARVSRTADRLLAGERAAALPSLALIRS